MKKQKRNSRATATVSFTLPTQLAQEWREWRDKISLGGRVLVTMLMDTFSPNDRWPCLYWYDLSRMPYTETLDDLHCHIRMAHAAKLLCSKAARILIQIPDDDKESEYHMREAVTAFQKALEALELLYQRRNIFEHAHRLQNEGMAYQRRGLESQARYYFDIVKTKYPGFVFNDRYLDNGNGPGKPAPADDNNDND